MSAPAVAPPDPRAQLTALIFALLLVDEDTRIVEANHAAEALFGRSAGKMLGARLDDIVAFEDRRVRAALDRVDGQLTARGIALSVRERTVRVNLTSSPMPSHPGWRVLTFNEVAREDERESERDFGHRAPAILAHEIKNPLSAIRGAAQLLDRRVDEKDRKLTGLIAGEVDRIAGLVDRMQTLGSATKGETEACNLHEAIRGALATVRAARPEGPELVEEFDPSIPRVSANRAALEQVLINLLSNAADACRSASEPAIRIATRYNSGLVYNVVTLGRATRLPVEITVSDNGPGIDPALRDHVFEPFVTSKRGGQGLGLPLVRKLVRDMGGRIAHERDERGGWTHFRIHLSVAREAAAA